MQRVFTKKYGITICTICGATGLGVAEINVPGIETLPESERSRMNIFQEYPLCVHCAQTYDGERNAKYVTPDKLAAALQTSKRVQALQVLAEDNPFRAARGTYLQWIDPRRQGSQSLAEVEVVEPEKPPSRFKLVKMISDK